MPRFVPYGYSRQWLNLPIMLTGFLSVATQQTLTTLGFATQFEVEKIWIVPVVAATGVGASRVINVRKGTATGTIVATVTATLANGALGTTTAGTVTTSSLTNVFGDADTLTVELPAGGTAFTAGQYELVIQTRLRNQRAA